MARPCVALLVALGTAGCSSGYVRVAPAPPAAPYVSLGRTEAEYCGYFSSSRRFERAYADALAKVPGAQRLIHVEIRDGFRARWVMFRCATVRGEAIK